MRRFLIALALLFSAAVLLRPGLAGAAPARTEAAIFAGGCFWCVEHDFEKAPGVLSAVSGYTGGRSSRPTYENHEGHVEAVKVTFDPARITYAKLLDGFWRTIDPTDDTGQFCDKGSSYRSAIFVSTPEQRRVAEQQRAQLNAAKFKGGIKTEIRDASTFWPAEAYHQQYAEKNPLRYNLYRTGCGRDARLKAVWGGR